MEWPCVLMLLGEFPDDVSGMARAAGDIEALLVEHAAEITERPGCQIASLLFIDKIASVSVRK